MQFVVDDVWCSALKGRAKRVKKLLGRNRGRVGPRSLRRWVDAESPFTSWTPLHCAAVNGHTATVRVVLAAGPKTVDPVTDDDERTPLHMAAENGHVETVRLLLTVGANPCATDAKGHSPLHLACEESRLSTVKCFFEFDDSEDHSLVVNALGDALGTFSEKVEAILEPHEKQHKDALWMEKAEAMRAGLGF